MELDMHPPFVHSVWQEKKNSTYGTGIPNWRCYKQVSWEDIQIQWSRRVCISQNNKEPANTCAVFQQPGWLQPKALASYGIFNFFLGIY